MNSYRDNGNSVNRKQPNNKRALNTNVVISAILRISSSISIVFMLLGLGLFLANFKAMQSVLSYHSMGLGSALTAARDLNPLALMSLGLVILIATPFLRVVGAILSFLFVDRDRKYALVSMGVLIIIIISLFIPSLKG